VKTDDLIRALAADCTTRPMPLRRAFAVAMIPGVAIAFCLYLAILGPRPHFLGLLTDRNQCAVLLENHPVPRLGAACGYFVLSAAGSAGTSSSCRGGGGSPRRSHRRGALCHALPG
jgi:hypothetical protein